MSSTLERLVVSSEQKPTTRLQEVSQPSIKGGSLHGSSPSGHYIADPKDVLPTISFLRQVIDQAHDMQLQVLSHLKL